MHQQIEPPILYLGTPVVLISTINPDGSPNISPMSSAWWLGWSCMLGLDASSQTTLNLLRTGECVLNLPSASEVAHVDRLARKTASDPMPPHKVAMGWEIERDKFGRAELTPQASIDVAPPRAAECPVQLEAHLIDDHPFAESDPRIGIAMRAIEVRITRVHADPKLLSQTHADRFEPDTWNPLLMSFLQFYARGENIYPSHLAELPQEAWAGRKPRRLDLAGG
jgi:flavin reductase (DIM6/NTAB) family NADH-FMN oxidoreductase RutF